MQPVVILGSGLAGYAVARQLRRIDATTPITLVTRDDGCAYSKPMLSFIDACLRARRSSAHPSSCVSCRRYAARAPDMKTA